ncbi:MAG: ribosome maturation factor RimP [Candidatus Electrothrix sp. AS4_5]|nr:ribosome maturation factor RimP [Candidatus Electrothrix gigas]
MGLELVDVQFKQEAGWVLRIFIDQKTGVNVDDCAAVSRQVATYLEVEDVIQHAYTLEVSSPGAERPLKRLEDFVRFSGKKVRIKYLGLGYCPLCW